MPAHTFFINIKICVSIFVLWSQLIWLRRCGCGGMRWQRTRTTDDKRHKDGEIRVSDHPIEAMMKPNKWWMKITKLMCGKYSKEFYLSETGTNNDTRFTVTELSPLSLISFQSWYDITLFVSLPPSMEVNCSHQWDSMDFKGWRFWIYTFADPSLPLLWESCRPLNSSERIKWFVRR